MKNPADRERCEAEETSLPWLRTWKRVYLFVIGSFVLWIALLIALTDFFS